VIDFGKRFLEKSKVLHNDKFDYSLVEYVNNRTKVSIICPVHGEFTQIPHSHLSGNGCDKCARIYRKSTTEEFISKAKLVHNDKYDYSLVEYVESKLNVKIICPVHGEFTQTPSNHLSGSSCHKCNCLTGYRKSTTEEFISKAKLLHNDKFDYSLVDYINNRTKVSIICPVHGEFTQTPASHLSGRGCLKCANANQVGSYNLTTLNRDPKLANTPALLYLIKHENLYKVGITILTIQQRFNKSVNVIGYISYTLLQAFTKEQELLGKYSKYAKRPKNWNHNGDTEFLKLSKSQVKTLLSEFKTHTPLWV